VLVQVLDQAELLRLCIEHALPANDAWLFAGRKAANEARHALDRVAGDGSQTAEVVGVLDALVAADAQARVLGFRGQ
jgi:hypothetical protein